MLGIRADGARMHKLLDAPAAGMLDEVQPHRHVGVEEPARLGHVGPDAPDLGGQVDHHVGPGVGIEPLHVRLDREVVVALPRHDDALGSNAPLPECATHGGAEEAGAAGDHNPFPAEIHRH